MVNCSHKYGENNNYLTLGVCHLFWGGWNFLLLINPVSPKCDQYQNSPCDINALWNRLVMRVKEMITQDNYNELMLKQLLITTFIGNVWGQQMGIWILILGLNGLTPLFILIN